GPRRGVARTGDAGSEDADPVMLTAPRGRVQAHLATRIALAGLRLTGRVDESLLRKLAQPAEWVAVSQIRCRQILPRRPRHLLKNVVCFDAPPHPLAQPPVDERQELRAERPQIIAQRRRVAGPQSLGE